MTLVSDALAIARAGIRAVDPSRAVRRNLVATSRGLRVGRRQLTVPAGTKLHVFAIGKAAAAMADAVVRLRNGPVGGLVVTPRGYPAPTSSIPVAFGDHPVPGPGSFDAGHRLLRAVAAVPPDEPVLFLISGGGSAVAEVAAPPLTPGALTRTSETLLASGAPIGAMNAIRRHLSALKGGRLALACPATQFATIALSDVVGDLPEDIASGPTVGDPTTFDDALRVLNRYRVAPHLPAAVARYISEGAQGRRPETPKPGEPRLRSAPFVLAATNRIALRAAAAEARRRGYRTSVLSSRVTGETEPVARAFARAVRRRARSRGPQALLSGGETTVTLGPRPGHGGRNQEFALAAAAAIRGIPAVVLSIGTDGVDGPTDAAGGVVDGRSVDRARTRGVDLDHALRRHAAYDALAALGGLLRTGPTGTNVMDLHVGLIRSRSRSTAGSSRPGAAPSSRRTRS